jgi:TolB-like protein/Tfp pilus assembly protein PilF
MAIRVASAVGTCSVCGEPLNAKGDCLACLLRTALDESLVDDKSSVSLIFGDFEILRHEDGSLWELGRGAMGMTYLAVDNVLGRRVALKVIELPAAPTRRESQAVRERFLREARAAAALRHPNVAAVFQFGASPDGKRCYYAMELVEGETLEIRVRRDGPLNTKLALEIAIQITRALIAAANHGLIHRDLKPGNIMLTRGDTAELEVKVIDFGLAKAVADAETETDLTHGEFVGTPNFASPEQFASSPVDVRSDIYSLGATLWFALTGKTPFAGRSVEEIRRAQKSDALPTEQLKAARVPSRLRSLLKSMLALEPAVRPGVQDLAARLRRCSAQTSNVHRVRVAIASAGILILGAFAFFISHSLRTHPTAAESVSNLSGSEKRIAVLPFDNLSNDREDASFADGLQDDLLTKLAKIADLKVISRTSVMQYRGERDTHGIGNALDVSHVLEGSVRKTGAWLHINAQLIDTRTDTHVWAEQYDRDLKDLFAIQSEIAQKVAAHLHAKISAAEKLAVERPSTADLTAFDFYNRAKNFLLDTVVGSTATRKASLLKAADLLNQAVAHDPTFFQAYCQLAWTHDYIYFDGWDRTPARLERADAAIQAAFRLRPDAGEAHLARAWHLYWGYRDYDGALAEVEKARATLPNDPWVFQLIGYIRRRQRHWEESTRNLERALDLDPRNFTLLRQIAILYDDLRRYADQEAALDRALALRPDDLEVKMDRANVEIDWKANTGPVHQLVDEIHAKDPGALQSVADYWLLCALAERDPAAAANALVALGDNSVGTEKIKYGPRLMEGLVARMAKDDAKAHAAFTAARAEQEKLVRANPDDAGVLCILGLIDAGLGRKEEALREGRRGLELLPVEKDARSAPAMMVCFARIAAWVGENDLACEQLARAARLPSSISYGDLKLMPWWDPLRGDPCFEKLVASLAPKANQSVALGAASSENPMMNTPEKSIAVLPFENASKDPNAEYLSEGISEALINSLTELKRLRVIARSTAFHYKGKEVDPRRVGRELQVTTVLTGRVRQMQDALSVQVDLVDIATGAQLWGAAYDRKTSDVIAVKQAIAREVTDKLKLKLSGEEQRRLVKRDSTNAEAYQFYLRGRYFWNKRTPDGIKRAIEEFQQAIGRDPNFALGYVGLADSYTALTFYNFAAPQEAMPKAKASALKALSLDNTVAEAHASLAHVLMNYDWDWGTAEKEFKRSIELKPDYATAHQWYAIHYLTATSRLEEALQEMKKALELEPASLVMNTFMGSTLYYAGRYDEAIDQCRRTIEMDPNFAVVHWHLGLAYEQKQLFDEAIEEFRKAISLSGGSPLMTAALGHAYAKGQKTDEANKILDELNELSKQEYVSPYELATIYVTLGNNEKAFQLLEKAYTEHSFHLVNLKVSPHFKSVRSDPRFQDLVQRIGLAR